MPKRQRRQNGTRISLSNPPSSTTAVATAAETSGVENNGSKSPEIANAARGERRLAVRAALPPALADDIDDVSSTHSNTADGSNDSSDESYAPDSSGMHQRPKKNNYIASGEVKHDLNNKACYCYVVAVLICHKSRLN
jgi:hypothetical protein